MSGKIDYKEELKGLIKDLIGEAQLEENKEVKDANDERIAKMLEENAELKARLGALEKAPTKKIDVNVPGTDKTNTLYKGYDLTKQGETLSIKDEGKKAEISKFLIDVIQGKTMNEGTGTAGGYLVPEEYQNEILSFARLQSVALQDCRVLPMGRDVMNIPAEGTSVSVDWASSETDPNTITQPVIAQVKLETERMGAYVPCTNDLLEDSAFDVVSWLTELFAEAVGQELDNQVFNGTTLQGLLGNAGYSVQMSAGNTAFADIAATDLSFAMAQLSSNKMTNAKFYMNKLIKHYLRQMVDGTGRLIYTTPSGIVPASIYEIPVRDVEKMPSVTDVSTEFILLGDMKNYMLGRRRGMTLKANPYILMKENQTQFVVSSRWAGQIGLANGFVEILTAAS